jgi:NitT/TauT family transport system substrate-binding protein
MNKYVLRIALLYITLICISSSSSCGSPPPLKVGTMPIIDSLPLSLARYKPIFSENGLVVEAVYFDSPSGLRGALVDGRVDAIITDLAGALLINERKERGKIVRISLRPSPRRPMFAIMMTPHQPIAMLNSLENTRIAVSREAMDRYVVDRLLSAAGISRWT